MEAFAPPESLHDLIEYDDEPGFSSNDQKLDEQKSSNPNDDTDDALETMLMDDNDPTESENVLEQMDVAFTTKEPASTASENKVTPTHPIQIFTQQKVGSPVVTKFIVKKSLQAPLGKQINTITYPITTVHNKTAGLQAVSLGNNLTLSPVKGGFKIPISPLKSSSMKVSVVPVSSSTSSLRTINLSKPIGGNRTHFQSNSNFQFQTLAPSSQLNIGNPQQMLQNIQMQPQVQIPAQKVQCVRLLPSSNGSSTGTGITNVITPQGNSTLPIRPTTILQTQRIQPFVNIQQAAQATQQRPHQRLIMPATSLHPNPATVANLSPGTVLQAGNIGYAMVPAKYVEQLKKQLTSQMFNADVPATTTVTAASDASVVLPQSMKVVLNGKVRKPCNCTKSMCLKLYCECFANGHFCDGCNCINCHNNLEFDGDRSKAIKSCLERNPLAFRPKIGRGRDDNRTHQKGCNCKRSGCLKNYCECYEARIPCTSKCKCIGCKNLEEDSAINNEQRSLMNLADAAAVRCQQQAAAQSRITSHIGEMRPHRTKIQNNQTAAGEKLPCTFFTQEVIEATCTCLLAQAEEAEKTNRSVPVAETMILEEFGRCLMQIIQAANKAKTVPQVSP